MKYLLILITIMLVGGCATPLTPEQKQKALRDSAVGTYEEKQDGDTYRLVLLENGIVESYKNGKKREEEGKWKISKEGELHDTYSNGNIFVFRINKDGSITLIARIDADGKRKEAPKEHQIPHKKIK